jgi:hypothetical protein
MYLCHTKASPLSENEKKNCFALSIFFQQLLLLLIVSCFLFFFVTGRKEILIASQLKTKVPGDIFLTIW